MTNVLDNEKTEIIKYVEENFLNNDKFKEDKEEKFVIGGDSSGGSDSEPSVDNFDQEELIKLLPTKSKNSSKKCFLLYTVIEKKKKKKITFNYQKEKKPELPKLDSFKSVPVIPKTNPTPVVVKPIERKLTAKPSVILEIKKDEYRSKTNAETQTEEIFFKL